MMCGMTCDLIRPLVLACCVHAAHNAISQTVILKDVDSGLTSPQGNYRSLDVADQVYSAAYRTNYNYTQAAVSVTFNTSSQPVRGVLLATNLKPNFAYQLKLVGTAGTSANEKIGRAGRYWQEVWNGTAWANGWNLNDKGSGHFPTPNDTVYFANREVPDPTSPTGRKYKYTCYVVFDYFITDSQGNATVTFQVHSSYHVLWKTSQQNPGPQDGPVKSATFDPSPSQPAYDVDYAARTEAIYGEWERLPLGGIQLMPGEYQCQVILTEESFHGSGGQYAGGWAAAMGGEGTFRVAPRLTRVSVANNAVLLELVDCYLGITNRLERCFELGQASGWQEVFTFVSTTPNTNWSETIPAGFAQAFYRVTSQVAP
jgi:hypothetical protein